MSGSKKRVSKHDWIEKGLELLKAEGVSGVSVERMARELEVAKSGFYWHFADRDDLLREMLDDWEHEYTEVVSQNAEIVQLPPRERLRRAMQMVLDHDLTELDLSMRAWAGSDRRIARRIARVYDARMDFIGRAFAELGFEGEELEMRTRLFVAYQSWERIMFWREPKTKLRRLIDRRLELLLHE